MRFTENDPIEVHAENGVVYEPWALGEMVGYRIWHPSGAVQYIYLNPSTDSADGVNNVVVYIGSSGDPAEDEPCHHYDIDAL